MGGRGQRRYNPGRVGTSSGPKWSNGIGTKVDGTLKEAIGEKGSPIPPTSAASGANPNFDRSFTYAEYTMNCQRCVVAYELRRRGYDVRAQPTYRGDTLPYSTKGGNARWMGAFRGAKSIDVGADRNSTVRKNIESEMKGFGPGSRGIILVRFQGTTSGHVFNVENVGGKIRYYDAQMGESVKINDHLSGTSPAHTRLVRTDNLRMSDRAKNFVTTRKY